MTNRLGDLHINSIMISNFAYTSGYTFLGSLFLSVAIILKHCLYKAYYKGKLNKKLMMMIPFLQSDNFKKIELGVIIKI